MEKYFALLQVDDEELEAILKDLADAQEKIWSCYSRLKEIGVVEIKKSEAASGN